MQSIHSQGTTTKKCPRPSTVGKTTATRPQPKTASRCITWSNHQTTETRCLADLHSIMHVATASTEITPTELSSTCLLLWNCSVNKCKMRDATQKVTKWKCSLLTITKPNRTFFNVFRTKMTTHENW